MNPPSAPPPPDPAATAAAQGAINKDTAVAQARLNNVNQRTPYGTLTYNEIGENNGVPRFEAVTELSPEQKGLFDLGTKTQTNLGQIGVEQSDKIRSLLNTPLDLSNEAVESRLNELAQKRLNPMLAQRRASTEQNLFNRGVKPGTEAYNNAMKAVTEGENDALNQLLLTGRGQSIQETLTGRNQPINEISALLSNSLVQQPNFASTPQTGIQTADITGPTYASYNATVANNNAKSAGQNAMLGGLFGLGGKALGGWATGGFKV